MVILVVATNLDGLRNYPNWPEVDKVMLVNVGHPEFTRLRKSVNHITRRHIFRDSCNVIIFPPFDYHRVTHPLLKMIGELYEDDEIEVIG